MPVSPLMMPVKSYLKLPDVLSYVDMFALLHTKHLADKLNFALFHCMFNVI